MMIVQISKSMGTIPMQCTFVISLFNLICLIVCQIHFPGPKPLFITLLIQALLRCISILGPDFLIFLMTCWLLPSVLYYYAKKLVSDTCIHIYIYIYI